MSNAYRVNVDLVNVAGKKYWKNDIIYSDVLPERHLKFLLEQNKITLEVAQPSLIDDITVKDLKIYLSNKGINYSGMSLKADLYTLYLNTFK